MNELKLLDNGDIAVIMNKETDISPDELRIIVPLQAKSSELDFIETELQKEITNIEIKLSENEEYIRLQKYLAKLKIVRKMKSENEIILNNEMRKIFKRNGIENIAERYSEALPEPKPKSKRGRPSKREVLS